MTEKQKVKNKETEQMLSVLQEKYLVERDEQTFKDIFEILYPYARSKVLKTTAGKKYLPPDLVSSYAIDATIEFLSQYDKPTFKVDLSFGGLLGLKVLEVMYGPKIQRADKIGSLNEHIENGSARITEFGDLQESLGFSYLWSSKSDDLCSDPSEYMFRENTDVVHSLMSTFRDLFKVVNIKQFIHICIGVIHFIEKKRGYERFRERILDTDERKLLDITLLELLQRLRALNS